MFMHSLLGGKRQLHVKEISKWQLYEGCRTSSHLAFGFDQISTDRKSLDPESCAVGPSLPATSARRPGMLHVHPTARDPAMGTL